MRLAVSVGLSVAGGAGFQNARSLGIPHVRSATMLQQTCGRRRSQESCIQYYRRQDIRRGLRRFCRANSVDECLEFWPTMRKTFPLPRLSQPGAARARLEAAKFSMRHSNC